MLRRFNLKLAYGIYLVDKIKVGAVVARKKKPDLSDLLDENNALRKENKRLKDSVNTLKKQSRYKPRIASSFKEITTEDELKGKCPLCYEFKLKTTVIKLLNDRVVELIKCEGCGFRPKKI